MFWLLPKPVFHNLVWNFIVEFCNSSGIYKVHKQCVWSPGEGGYRIYL